MKASEIKNVAVVGYGVMGSGIAQVFAQEGLQVSLVYRNDRKLEKALQQIRDNLELFVEMGILKKDEPDKVLGFIHPTKDMEAACCQCNYMTEAVPEVMETKQEILHQAEKWCPENAILAANTSSLSIEQIASATKRPELVVGTHWVMPAHIMQLVEVVRGPKTSSETISITRDLMERIGKVPVVCKDSPGFLNNAMQFGLYKVAMDLHEKGIATAEDIDRAVNHGFGFRLATLGPFRFLDFGGLDPFKAVWEYIESKTENLGPFPEFLRKLVEKGHLGFKTGKGIYEYSEDEIRNLTRERNQMLIQQLKTLGRIG
jgi:3-hydroxybutyryl-CoA dehydrogenase